ncbi:putative ribonuclease H-like domain-containing protein, partial [Tanacetum coccineum]
MKLFMEEDIAFLKYDVKVRDNSITELKNQLAEALREKDDLKLKLEKFETSSMKLTKLINSQISVNNKSGVSFNSQINENDLHDCHLNKSKVFESASDSSVNEIEDENNQVNDRFKKVKGYHAVPPPYTGNYMPSRPDLSFVGLDNSVYKNNVSETISSVPRIESTASKSSKDSLEQPKDVRPIKTARVNNVTTGGPKAVVSTTEGKRENAIKSLGCWIWRPIGKVIDHISKDSGSYMTKRFDYVDQGIFDNGCFMHLMRTSLTLSDYQTLMGGFVALLEGSIKTNVNAGQADRRKHLIMNTYCYHSCFLILHSLQVFRAHIIRMLMRVSTVNPSVSATGQGFDNADDQERIDSSTQDVNTAGPSINIASENINTGSSKINTASPIPNDPSMQSLEETSIFDDAYDDREEVGAEDDLNNLVTTMNVSSIPTTRIHKDHPIEQIIRDLHSALLTRRMLQQNFKELGLDSGGSSKRQRAIGTKWVYRNKKDERGIVVRNKARLVAQGYTQEEGIDYDEVFAPVARIEAIRLFLAYASFMGLIVYQMDVKSAFLYGTIEEEVYVCQPPGFEDPQFPDKVYKVEKALYGLHQAPRAWYETLSTYLLENGYRRGTIDKTLFIKKDKGDILLVQVYVDDIIFGSTKKSLCVEFEQMMHKRFQMSSMGELTFFLGLQVQQKEDGIFISQDKYVADILKKFDFTTIKASSTLIETNKALLKDEEAEDVNVHLYRSMIGSLMYLTASRPDIMFVVCACASDYAGASLDKKSTTGGCQFLGKRLISWQCKKLTIVANSTTEVEYVAVANCRGQ